MKNDLKEFKKIFLKWLDVMYPACFGVWLCSLISEISISLGAFFGLLIIIVIYRFQTVEPGLFSFSSIYANVKNGSYNANNNS